MTRARIMIALVCVGVVALVVWAAQHVVWDEIKVPMPWKGEARREPFYAAQHLVQELGATSECRQILGDLAGDSVILLSNWAWDVSTPRRHGLEQWVEAGGRLVVDSTLISGSNVFETWSGVQRASRMLEPAEREERNRERRSQPDNACPEIHEQGSSVGFAVCGTNDFQWLNTTRLTSWQLRNEAGAQVVRMPRGLGSVTVINVAPFAYRSLFLGDHAALLVAAAQLHAGDHLVFMSEEHYDSLLVLAWRFGAPAVILLLAFVLLALWRGGRRFGPLAAETVTARRSLAEQILGTGRFTLRWGGGAALHAAAVRALGEAASRRIAGYAALRRDGQIAAIAKLARVDGAELAYAMSYSTDRSFELRRAVALLESARRQLLGSNWSPHGNRNQSGNAGSRAV